MSSQKRKYQTQWASQFYAAAELTRRGYLVSMTFGNAPAVDLVVVSPNNVPFLVDVKGQSTRNFWLIQSREVRDDFYFILVYLAKQKQPTYYILTCKEMIVERNKYKQHIIETKGNYRDDLGGMNWSEANKYENRWEILPA